MALSIDEEIELLELEKQQHESRDVAGEFNTHLGRGALAAGEIIGSIPGAIAGGVAGLGMLAATGGDLDTALKSGHEVLGALTPSQMLRNAGEIVGSEGLVNSIDEFRGSPEYRELIERPFGALTMGVRDLGSTGSRVIGKKDFDSQQRGADWAELGLIGLGALGLKGGKGKPVLSEAARLELEKRMQPPVEKVSDRPSGQMELPLNEREVPYGMMERAQERYAEAMDQLHREMPIDPQGDFFKPDDPSLYPGMERSKALQAEREAVPYEGMELAPKEVDNLVNKTEPFRPEDLNFPLRQEAWEADPYVKTLAEEHAKWAREAQGKDPARAERAFENAKEVERLAQEYATRDFNMSTPDRYTGSLWGDEKALPIEKTPTYDLGKSGPHAKRGTRGLEKTSNPLNTGPRGRQRGTVSMEFLTLDDLKWIRNLADNPHVKKLIGRLYYDARSLDSEFRGGFEKKDSVVDQVGQLYVRSYTDRVNMLKALDPEHKLSPQASEAQARAYARERVIEDLMYRQQEGEVGFTAGRRDLASRARASELKRLINTGRNPFKGPGKKQAGAINLGDPEFRKFKDSLPEPLKGEAKEMYREWQRMQEPKQLPAVIPGEPATRVADNIPGLKSWRDEIAPITATPQELKPSILKEPDLDNGWIARQGRQLISGGKLLGFATQNTVVRYVVQNVDNALREASKNIENLILNDKTGFKPKWEKLSKDEMAEAWATLVAHEGKLDLSRNQLIDMGLSDRQIAAMTTLREAELKVFDMINQARVALGKEPVKVRPGHLPSRFRGDFLIRARNAEGDLVHMMGANTKWGADRIRKEMAEKFPDLKFEEVTHEPLHRFKDASDAQMGYQALVEALSDSDPLVKALEDAYSEYMKKQGYDMLAFKNHFKAKVGVQGGEGFKAWEDGITNAKEGLRSIMNYMDHAMKWAEMNKNVPNIKAILKDKEISDTQPVATRWARQYMDQAMGRSTDMARTIDKLADVIANQTGIGQSLQVRSIREAKKWITVAYLGAWNMGFSLSQMVQVLQTAPAWMHTFIAKGNLDPMTMTRAYYQGMIDGVKGYALGRENMSPLGREAWEYAKDYGIVEPKVLDDVKSIGDKDTSALAEWLFFKSMTWPERMARTTAYMSWVHFLHESRAFKMGPDLYQAAANLTDMTMVDYRQHERPMLYKHMGIMGEAANALTTFKHNYFSQAHALTKHAGGIDKRYLTDERGRNVPAAEVKDKSKLAGEKEKGAGIGPIATFVGMLALLSGVMGMPGREDIDALIKLANNFTTERLPSTKELLLEYMPDSVSFGPISALTGMDFSSKFSAANVIPDDWLSAFAPFAGTISDVVKEGYEFAKDPNATSGMQLLNKLSPNSMKWMTEDTFFTKHGITQDPQLGGGQIRRDDTDRLSRKLGVRSLDEQRQKQAVRTVKEQDQFNESRRAALLKSANERAYAHGFNREEMREIARKYVEAEGDPRTFVNGLVGKVKDQHLVEIDRMLLEAKNNPRRMKRVQEMRK